MARRAESCAQQDAGQPLTFVGDEWSDRKSLEEVLDEYVFPFCPAGAVAGEIGCGGGRVAAKVIPRCSQFHCFDISAEMLRRAREAFSGAGVASCSGEEDAVKFTLLSSNALPAELTVKYPAPLLQKTAACCEISSSERNLFKLTLFHEIG